MNRLYFYKIKLQSIKKVFVFIMMSSFMAHGQGPDPCPCDPTEGEVAYEACLAAHPECDEEIPIDNGIYFLVLAGLGYGLYTIRSSNKVQPVVSQN